MCIRARIVTYVSFIWFQANSTFWHIDINTKILTIKWANYIICNHHIMIALQHLFSFNFFMRQILALILILSNVCVKCSDILWCCEVKGPENLLLRGPLLPLIIWYCSITPPPIPCYNSTVVTSSARHYFLRVTWPGIEWRTGSSGR